MQACGQQKLSGSSFAGGYIYGIPERFHSVRLTVTNTVISMKTLIKKSLPTSLHDDIHIAGDV
jgi:hypothetical protein